LKKFSITAETTFHAPYILSSLCTPDPRLCREPPHGLATNEGPGRAKAKGAGRDNWRGPAKGGAEAVYAHRGKALPLAGSPRRDIIME